MPPKKAAAAAKPKPAAKSAAQKRAAEAPAEEQKPAKAAKVVRPPVDSNVPSASSYEVVEADGCFWDAMLNQTNVGANNNKYYVIQLLQNGSKFFLWTRWGRVGESGQNSLQACSGLDAAKVDFGKKFQDKTKNKWRATPFVKHPGKYDLVEVNHEEDAAPAPAAAASPSGAQVVVRKCTLEPVLQDFLQLIFSEDMFKESMAAMKVDTNKMPLGKLSQAQVQKGYEALEALETAIEQGKTKDYDALTSAFYTIIPHDFGRNRPPIISTKEEVQQKFDLLNVLNDITIAQQIDKETKDKNKAKEEIDHPLTSQYGALKCKLTPIQHDSPIWKTINTYMTQTLSGRKLTLLEAFEMDRDGEKARFSVNKSIAERKLLWHGTNVAVVAAILKTGLRIMPHSGGRVGKGIYFASECSKSAGYVGTAKTSKGQVGIMFLNEVALGKEHTITVDDHTLRVAPKGCDCIVARGWTEPDPTKDTTISGEFGTIVVPQGAPVKQEKFTSSRFSQSEYLVYREDQVRMKYVLKIKFDW